MSVDWILPVAGDLRSRIGIVMPGLLFAAMVALAATFLSEHYGGPAMLFALLLGMAFNFLADDERTAPGISFASKAVLRLGVGLLGARITAGQIVALGPMPVLLVTTTMAATIGCGLLAARLFGRHWTFGLLTGGAVAICGASAALAIAAVLPQREDTEENTLFTVVAVTSLSTIAMIVYPMVFSALGFDDVQMGILFGATIHDVAQVVGAGYAVSDEAGDMATFVKLMRVALLPVVLLAIVAFAPRGKSAGRVQFPSFVLLFAALVLLNSIGAIPAAVSGALSDASRWMLIVAIAALGVKTALKKMVALGGGHFAIVVGLTVFLATLATVAISFA